MHKLVSSTTLGLFLLFPGSVSGFVSSYCRVVVSTKLKRTCSRWSLLYLGSSSTFVIDASYRVGFYACESLSHVVEHGFDVQARFS